MSIKYDTLGFNERLLVILSIINVLYDLQPTIKNYRASIINLFRFSLKTVAFKKIKDVSYNYIIYHAQLTALIIIINIIISEKHFRTDTMNKRKVVSYGGLTFAGLPITSQAKSGTTAAAPGFVAPAEKADVRASSRLTIRVNFTRMALD